ncbi:MAG TPA: SDR family NAD(P)-dependent oxidoreductase [Nitrososphaera sp.]|nr:SDR family NAD(P)-dependent oxidoreductase [Nitrososphaera sp.]
MLKDKVAIVTGSSRGIGLEVAKEFAARGAKVILCSRNLADVEKCASTIGDRAYPERLDVTDTVDVKKFIRRTAERHGGIDILVNNAGYPFDRKIWKKRFHEVTEDEFDKIIQVDLKGTLRLCISTIPIMIRGGGGVIINISSTPAISGCAEGAPYTVAKAGIIAITKHIALEYGVRNIRAYALALGNISTDATFKSMTVAERKKAAMENSMKRWGKPSEVATVAASVASDDFAFATGNTIVIDGGSVLL